MTKKIGTNKTKILESLDKLETFVNKATKDELINAFGLDKDPKNDFNPYAFLEDYIVDYNKSSQTQPSNYNICYTKNKPSNKIIGKIVKGSES